MRKLITSGQIKKLHTLLSRAGMMEHKRDLIEIHSNGRVTSSKELFYEEAKSLIDSLDRDDTCEKMKRKIFAILFEMKWIYEGDANEWKMNMAKIDGFLLRKGSVRKKFYDLNCVEVRKVLTQFESIQKHTRESSDRNEANEAFNEVLAELGLTKS